MDSHAGDFGAISRGALQTPHGHEVAGAFSNNEFPSTLEKRGFDLMKIREICLRCGHSSDVAGKLM
jgi:hypothetical protein